MSYDFCWHMKKGRRTEVAPSINYTSNISPMLYAVLGEEVIEQMKEGVPCVYARNCFAVFLSAAIERQDELRDMDPENGWGNYEGFLHTILDVIFTCDKHPESWFRLDA